MPDTRLSQSSFTAGELSPELWAREDLQRYQLGARLVENFYIRPHGGVTNRAGLRFVTEVKDSAKVTRLMTFEAAADDAYLLEVGDTYIRPIFRGGPVLDGGLPYEIATPYGEDELFLIYLEQSNDVATLTHPDYAVRELARYSELDWELTTVTFQPGVAAPTGVSATATEGYTDYGTDKNPIPHTYVVSTIGSNGEESLPSSEATSGNVVLGYDKNYVTISWTGVADAVEYIVYKEENGIFGFIGITEDTTFKDLNINPDFADSPQRGANPFNAAGNYPALVSFAQQRRVFAATDNDPQTTFMTQAGNFKNMGVSRPAKDDDAVEFTLAARRKQDIFHMVPLEKGLIMFTRSGEWRVTGREGDVITPSSILPEPISYYGSTARLRPLLVGESVLFATRAENRVRGMDYSEEVGRRYSSTDLTILAEHLFRNRTIVAWDYAGEPDSVIWCVMSDGNAISLTYIKEHDVWGWGRHKTAGRFLDVQCVPEGDRDVPYFLVQRFADGVWRQYIEYLDVREFDDIQDCFFVDSGLSLDNPISVDSVAVGEQTVLTASAHGLSEGAIIDVSGLAFVDLSGDVHEDFSGRYVASNVTTHTVRIKTEGGDDVDTSELAVGYYLNDVVMREAFTSIVGMDHLIGRNVVALCNGHVVDGLTVDAEGGVDFGDIPYSRIHVGLPYASRLQTLDIPNSQGVDTGIKKAVASLYLQVYETRGIKVGLTFDDLVEDFPRDHEDYGDPASLKTGSIPFETLGEWDDEVSVCVLQEYPLPATILGVTEEIAYGG